MKKLSGMLLLLVPAVVAAQLKPLPEGFTVKYAADSANEEFAINYCIDYSLVKKLFETKKIKPVFIPRERLPGGLDATKKYIVAGFLLVYCEKCDYNGSKAEFQASNWIFTDTTNTHLHPKAIGLYTAIETKSWYSSKAIVQLGKKNGIVFETAAFQRTEKTGHVDYSFQSRELSVEVSFDKDSVSADLGNAGLYQTVWNASNPRLFAVYSSVGHRLRRVRHVTLKVKSENPVLQSIQNMNYAIVQEAWSGIGGFYTMDE